ncbi:HAD family hydrolase [Paludisphaera sp.]|uniref:HAD family hydrolase n=1 Tax=Paludisphaera sp. TaxID=2017432 RepID=UPI00301C0597
MSAPSDSQRALREFPKRHDFFVGVDSDGCVFDTMEVKHKECFIPNIVNSYDLAAISKYVREAAEFINLYSHWRGINRFPALAMTLDLLLDRPEIAARRFKPPAIRGVREWIRRETKLSNPTLKAEVERTNDPDLARALAWSEAVNATVGQMVHDVPPFPFVRESLECLAGKADVMVVSATPVEALQREWTENAIVELVSLIAGQEHGGKKEHLALAAVGKYDADKILMIGDAPGDMKAALDNKVLFYPIDPGHEDESWQRFFEEALPKFLNGEFAGAYMDAQIARFEALLPKTPPWKLA